MSGWTVAQIILNIGFVSAALVCWARLNRPQKDDPRLSRGLQLLQSKIAILEDLSDRTDMQVKQLSTLLDQKGKEVQEYVANAQKQIHKVEASIQKSMDVSKIFQDKLPHKEIVERQNTVKYVQAARMAHQGMDIEDIAARVDIPRSELEFVVKVNKKKLMFSEEHLPDWAQESGDEEDSQPSVRPRDFSNVFESTSVNASTEEDNRKIQEEFKRAIEEVKAKEAAKEQSLTNTMADSVSESMAEGFQSAKNKLSDLAEKILNPYFVDVLSTDSKITESNIDVATELAAEVATENAIKNPIIKNIIKSEVKNEIKNEAEDPRGLKPFVFKKLSEEKFHL